jgi:SAM-dependent methyltransferase
VRWGSLRRLTPISREFGYDRGLPIDRYYIERFLAAHATDIRGRVLEVADATYTERFGGQRVSVSDVLDAADDNPRATIVADLATGDNVPEGAFDCVILTQTLQFVYDVPAALRTIQRILRPGGVVLATVPGISPISRHEADRWGHYWGFTAQSVVRLVGDVFGPDRTTVEAHGNVLAAVAFLEGVASEELAARELDAQDRDYPVVIAIRAVTSTDPLEVV